MQNVPIIVLDFGSQYTQLIARRLREEGVYCEIVPYNENINSIKNKNPKGVIFSGGPASIYDEYAYKIDNEIFNFGVPILGICYGMQLIAEHFGGKVLPSEHHEYGKAKLEFNEVSPIFKDIESGGIVWMSHGDRVEVLPKGFKKIAHSNNSPYSAISNEDKNIYAVQFHPEVVHTQNGGVMLKNFAINICNCEANWNMHNFAEYEIEKIKEKAKSGEVLCGVSGGVDSSVVATLIHKAIGERLVAVFVDHGLLRMNERVKVEAMFKQMGIKLVSIDASELFLSKLKGIIDPEKKRKIIGETFIEVFEAEAKKHKNIKYLAQGTLYPDVIESVSVKGPSKTIKSHHNVGGLPEWMSFELIEPLRELFKDEVRKLGAELNIEHDFLWRHPFPGPGLAIRIMGEVNKEDLDLLRKADVIMIDELKRSGYYEKTWQSFCVLLNVKSVGVMGDNRTYDNTICVRVVEGVDGMTATFAHLPYELLEKISTRIINEVNGINRVVYDISSKPPATIEWE